MYKSAFSYRRQLQEQMASLEKLSKKTKYTGQEFFDRALPLLQSMARNLDLNKADELEPKDPVTKITECVPSFDTGKPAPTYFEEGVLAWTQDFGEEYTDGEEEVKKALDHAHLHRMLDIGLEKKLLPNTLQELLRAEEWMSALEKEGGFSQYEVEMFYACLAHMRLSFRPRVPEYCEDVLVLDALAPSEDGSSDDSDYEPEEEEGDSDSDASETTVEVASSDEEED